MTVYALTVIDDSIDPRWFRQHIDQYFDECVVDVDGTIMLDGYRFRFSDGGGQLPTGRYVQVWFGRRVPCRPMDHAVEQVILAFVTRRGDITEHQAQTILEQARLIRLQYALLDLAIKGLVQIDLDADGQIVWVARGKDA